MKSREEILDNVSIKICGLVSYERALEVESSETFKLILNQAMTEYADQFAVEFAEWIVETLLTGNISMHGKPTADLLTIFKKERGLG